MPQPFNYALNIPNPAESVMGGVRDAVGLAGVMSSRKLAEEQALEKQAARERQAAMQAELSQLSEDASPAAIQKFMIRHPDMAKDMNVSLKAVSEGRRQADLGVVSQAYAALSSGNTDAAMTVLEQDAAARRNSGDEEGAKRAEAMAETIKINPNAAMAPMGIYVASVMGPDKFVENYSGMQGAQFEAELQPGKKALLGAQVSKAGSEAQKASVDAKYADQIASLNMQNIQSDIDLRKENTKSAVATAALKRAQTDAAREKAQRDLDAAELAKTEKQQTKAAEVLNSTASMDNMLNTADSVLKTPMDIVGSAAGPISSKMPTVSQDTADFEELVNTLSSQAFMAQIPALKGMGALSNAEGEKLQSSLQNLSLRQSPEQLMKNVKEAQRLILKAREHVGTKYGVKLPTPDRPAAITQPTASGRPQAQSGFTFLGID